MLVWVLDGAPSFGMDVCAQGRVTVTPLLLHCFARRFLCLARCSLLSLLLADTHVAQQQHAKRGKSSVED